MKPDVVFVGRVLEQFTSMTKEQCLEKCVFGNKQCKSFNTEHAGNKACQLLANASDSRVVQINELVSKPGWSYVSTDYSESLVRSSTVQFK